MDCAFVGAGAVAGRYADALDGTDLRLTAVCDLDADRAAALAADRDAAAYGDLDALLDAEPAPLVLNLTPHEAHADVTRRALAADRHVFSQKPLAMDAGTARDLVALAADRDLALGCAPVSHRGPSQRRAARALADGRLGPVRLAYAHAHVGRVAEWHDDPDSFLRVGPLYDGAVYPLALLVAWFGPVGRVRAADAATPWPDREPRRPERPSHVEATLAFADGPLVRLTASLYAPHRSREFNSVELHGDDGSLYIADCGRTDDDTDAVRFGREGRDYVSMAPDAPADPTPLAAAPARLAAAVESGRRPRDSARRAAHVVAVCNAVEREAGAERGAREGERSPISPPDAAGPPAPDRVAAPDYRPVAAGGTAVRLPPVGLGCSRYRDGEYVDRRDSIAAALDAGYRLLDSAELYGNESRIGRILDDPGTPDRSTLHLSSKVWNTNHGHVEEACRGTLDELGVGTLDSYLLHWPDAWAYRGPLRDLASLPVERQEELTFPRDDEGEIVEADASLDGTWRDMERLVDDGLTRTVGICNVSLDRLRPLVDAARIPPAVVQVECHPYEPRRDLVRYCHERGIRVVAHTPLSADGLLSDPAVREAADAAGATPAQVVLAWNVRRGVVPIPSSTRVEHLVENLAAASLRPDPASLAPLDDLADSEG
ncbi:MAG: aldo/keto reductase [Haloferacaceae archaeon]